MPAITLVVCLFFGVFCLLVLALILWLAFRLVDIAMKKVKPLSEETESDGTQRLKALRLKALTGLCILSVFAFGIWKLAFEPPPASDPFKEVFHQLPPASVRNLTVPYLDSWGDTTDIDLTFQISKPDLLKLIGTNGKAVSRKKYTDEAGGVIVGCPGKPTSYFISSKLCDPNLAICNCYIGYEDATQTAYVYSWALD